MIVQQGLTYRVNPTLPDTTGPGIDTRRLYGTLLDVRATDSLAWHTYRYSGLIGASEKDIEQLDPTASGMAYNLGLPFTQLALAYQAQGDRDKMIANLERAAKLVPDPNIKAALDQIRLTPFLGPDSARVDSTPPGQ
jgi:tetratricopeptide (TPR) repeat protein